MSRTERTGTDRDDVRRGNPIGVHAGLWVGDWSPDSARFAIESSAGIGYDLIEIPAQPVDSTDIGHTVTLLGSAGIEAVVSLALDADSDINTDDPEVSRRGEKALSDAVEFARAIGATYVGGVTFSAMVKYDHPATRASRENSLSVLRRIATTAAASGIDIGIEYVNRYESNLLNTAQQTADFVRELEVPNARVHMDTFHANSEETSLADAVRDAGALLGYIHASESHRGLLGTGTLDFPGLFGELARSGYRGPITFESFSPSVQTSKAVNTMGLWRTPWSDPEDAARSGFAFLSAQLAAAAPATSTSVPSTAP